MDLTIIKFPLMVKNRRIIRGYRQKVHIKFNHDKYPMNITYTHQIHKLITQKIIIKIINKRYKVFRYTTIKNIPGTYKLIF
jgi:hypothetical protein